MKRFLAACLAVALFLLCGCAGQESAEPSQLSESETLPEPSETADREDGSFGMSYLPAYGLNPYTCAATVNRAVFSLVFESLFVVSNQFRAEPLLCDSFTVSEDGRTYYYKLLPAVSFSDGTPLTAQDVVASLNAARDSELYAGRLSHVTEIAVQEEDTVCVTLDTPYENFSLMLDVPIAKADTVKDAAPVGTGAYAIDGNLLRRNAHWWQEQPPAVNTQTITLEAGDTPNEIRDHFEFGNTDLVYCDPNAAAAVGYRCDFEVWEVPTTVLHYIGFNTAEGLFSNTALRAAVTWMVDRETLSNGIYGGFAIPTMLPCSPDSDLYDAQLAAKYAYDLPRFRAAVNNSGVASTAESPGTFLVCSDDPTRGAVAEKLIEDFRGCGIWLNLKALPLKEYKSELYEGNFDLYYGEVRLTANFDLSVFFDSNGYLSYGGISSATLLGQCVSSLENTGNYPDLCRNLLETAPICPVVFKSYAIYVTRGKISSITPAVDCVFHHSATARTLADADRTYDRTQTTAAQEPEEPSESEP